MLAVTSLLSCLVSTDEENIPTESSSSRPAVARSLQVLVAVGDSDIMTSLRAEEQRSELGLRTRPGRHVVGIGGRGRDLIDVERRDRRAAHGADAVVSSRVGGLAVGTRLVVVRARESHERLEEAGGELGHLVQEGGEGLGVSQVRVEAQAGLCQEALSLGERHPVLSPGRADGGLEVREEVVDPCEDVG